MGPFGSGKSYLGKCLTACNVARYVDLEPIIYQRFDHSGEFDLESATRFLRQHFHEQLSSENGLAAFESTGVVQRPLLLEMIDQYDLGLIHVITPKKVCLDRVEQRNETTDRPIDLEKAAEFFDYWSTEIAPSYEFVIKVDGTDAEAAIQAIQALINQSHE